MKNRMSDLPWGAGETKVIIAQPKKTFKLPKERVLDHLRMFMTCGQERLDDDLTHFGTLTIDNHDGKPLCFSSCGGDLIFKSTSEAVRISSQKEEGLFYDWPDLARDSKMALVCDNPDCNAEFALTLSAEQTKSLILHLMIKQMIPELQTCSFVDCSQRAKDYHTSESKHQTIRELGLISLQTEILLGGINPYKGRDKFAIGFMLTPGMNTLDGCDGYDQWLKFLFLKKFEQIKEVLDYNAFMLRGPKQKRR